MKFDWSQYTGNLAWLPERTIFLTIHGSHAYGLNTSESDVDIKGITIPPIEYFYGFLNIFHQAESHNPDMVIYDIRKFISLAVECNPNIIEVLWTDEKYHYEIDSWWGWFGERLREHRALFLSRKARHTFSGYAVAQLKRIKTHRKWLLQPPKEKPLRSHYNLPETSALSKDLLGAIEATEGSRIPVDFPAHVMTIYHQERAYHNALREWQQYENWRNTRNKKRAELESKYGLDTKHAMHLVRLLRMCQEILETGKVLVERPDREELLAIRNGAWNYDQIIEWTEKRDSLMGEIEKNSPLPHGPDRKKLDELCCMLVEECFSRQRIQLCRNMKQY